MNLPEPGSLDRDSFLRSLLRIIVASVGLCLSMVSWATAAPPRVVFLDISPTKVDGGELPKSIEAEFRKGGPLALVTPAESAAALASRKVSPKECLEEAACLKALAASVQAEWVLTGALEQVRRGYVLTMAVGRPEAMKTAARTSESMRSLKSVGLNVPLCLERLLPATQAVKDELPPIPSPEEATNPAVVAQQESGGSPVPSSPAPSPSVAPATGGAKRVLVLDLKAVGVEEPFVAQLPGKMAALIAKQPLYDVASTEEVKALLQLDKTRQAAGCESDAACMAEISKKLNADLIVNGSVGRLGQSLVLSLSLLDSHEAGASRRTSETYESEEALKKGLPLALGQLFGWSGEGRVAQFHLLKGKKSSFAVFDLSATGVPPDIAKNLTQVLSSEVKGIEGTSVVSRDDILALLQFDKQKADLGCTEDTACMASIGGALGVDRLIVGTVGKVSEEYIITLRLIDARRAEVENRHTESFKGSEDQLIGATRQACRELLGLEQLAPGKLAVTASQTAAEVFVDNEKRGTLPLPPIEHLSPGRHHVRLTKTGFSDWQTDLYLSPVETTVAWAQLKEQPEKWYQKWWVWTAAGVVLAGGTTAAILMTQRPNVEGKVLLQ